MKKENTYIKLPLGRLIKWWKEKSTPETKGGSFNHDLYIRYLQKINS